jgi:hypothetical protein
VSYYFWLGAEAEDFQHPLDEAIAAMWELAHSRL